MKSCKTTLSLLFYSLVFMLCHVGISYISKCCNILSSNIIFERIEVCSVTSVDFITQTGHYYRCVVAPIPCGLAYTKIKNQ